MPVTELTLETPFETGQFEGYDGRFVLTDAYIAVAGIDVSHAAHSVRCELEREAIDVTSFANAVSGYREYMPGRLSGTFSVELFYDPVVLTPALWDSLRDGPVFVAVRPRSDPTAPGNPSIEGLCVATSTRSLFGDVGQAAAASIELHSTGEILVLEA